MIVPLMAISNLVLTQQIYSEETNGAHAHYREPVPLKTTFYLSTPKLSKQQNPTIYSKNVRINEVLGALSSINS